MLAEKGEGREAGQGRLALWVAIFSALSIFGNYAALSIGFNVNFIFGSVFGLMAVVLLGPLPGFCVSLLGASYTYVLWNHPYAIVIFSLEAAWLGLAKKRRPNAPLFFIDVLYWLLLGVPLVFLFYLGAMKLGLSSTGVIAIKQSLNGIVNTILASAALNYLPMRKLGFRRIELRKYSTLFFETIAFFLMLPLIGGFIFMNQRELQRAEESLAKRVAITAREAGWVVGKWLEDHTRATELLARSGEKVGFKSQAALQASVEEVHTLFPDFHNVFVADSNAVTLAFDPKVNERGESTIGIGFSDREWFSRLKESKKLVVSDVFMGRGGVFRPIVSIAAPIVRGGELVGFSLGAVNLDKLGKLIEDLAKTYNASITVVDSKGAIVVSSDGSRHPLEVFEKREGRVETSYDPSVHLYVPPMRKNVSIMQVWNEAVFCSTAEVANGGWSIYVEGALAPLQGELYETSIINMGVIYALLIATSAISYLFSRRLAGPLFQLSHVSRDLPAKIESGSSVDWPNPNSVELENLTKNFKKASEEIKRKVTLLKESNENLEEAVAQRTAELTTLNEKFRIIFENEIYAICLFDLDTLLLLDVNATFERLYGYSREEAVGRVAISDLACQGDESVKASLREIFAETAFIPLRRHRRKNGEVFPVEIVGGPYKWNQREVVFCLIHDISVRVEAESSLRESEARWQFALEGSGDGVWDWNAQTDEVYFSAQWKRMLGFEESEISASLSEWEKRVHPDDKAMCFKALERHFSGETEVYLSEHRVLTKSGEYKWVLDRGKVIEWTADGKPLRVIGTHTDITERKRAEERLREYAEKQRVLLKEINHRVKNNLAMILAMLRMGVDSAALAETKSSLKDLEGRVLALDAVHSMLSFSEWKALPLLNLCEAIIQKNLQNSHLTNFRIEGEGAAIAVESSKAHNLALVVSELATNSVKHALRSDGLKVRIRVAEEGGRIFLTYSDNGIGFPGEADRALGGHSGLALVRGIVEMGLSGEVEFRNDDGAVVEMSFPQVENGDI